MRTWPRVPLIFLALLCLTGCDGYRAFRADLKARISRLLHPKPSGGPKPAPTPTDYELTSDRAKRAKANGELLQEVMRVLFNTEVSNRGGVFGSLVESLNQGARAFLGGVVADQDLVLRGLQVLGQQRLQAARQQLRPPIRRDE